MINVGVIGCGYWGPNLIRNFLACQETNLLWASDLDQKRLEKVLKPYPQVKKTVNYEDILNDQKVDAVAIATPPRTHFPIAKACLEKGKHILVEKPLATDVRQGEELVELARRNRLQIMCDHTYCYSSPVRKIKEIVQSGVLGKLYYFDSVRINLGLFQNDINVVWDLAPHDLSILDFLIPDRPISVSAHGVSHTFNGIENISYVSLRYPKPLIAHLHLNWLSPIKIRRIMIGGCERMLVWDDLEGGEKIKIYDCGIVIQNGDLEKKEKLLVSYRSGDMSSPRLDQTEALALVVKEFSESIQQNRPALTDGESGVRILRILEALERSIKADGANVLIEQA